MLQFSHLSVCKHLLGSDINLVMVMSLCPVYQEDNSDSSQRKSTDLTSVSRGEYYKTRDENACVLVCLYPCITILIVFNLF